MDPSCTSPRRSDSMKLEPSRTSMGSKSRSRPPSGIRLAKVREPLASLVREGGVADGLRLAQRLPEPFHGLLAPPIRLVGGRVLQRLVGLHDGLPDLVGFHVAP